MFAGGGRREWLRREEVFDDGRRGSRVYAELARGVTGYARARMCNCASELGIGESEAGVARDLDGRYTQRAFDQFIHTYQD